MDNAQGKNEKEGLIPINLGMLSEASRKDDKLEYYGVIIGEITFVGFVVTYDEKDTKIIVGIWDQTGYREVMFYNKSETETHSGLTGFLMKDKTPARVFGKVKYFKDEIRIDGSKIMNVDMNEFIYHKIVLINDWMYLTSRAKEENEISHGISNTKSGMKQGKVESGKDRIIATIERLDKTRGSCTFDDLMRETKISEPQLRGMVDELIKEYIILEDGCYLKLY
jgi:hypothetical protein